MSNLAEVLAWHYGDVPGIRTREGMKELIEEVLDEEGKSVLDEDDEPVVITRFIPTGEMKIFDWPNALGNEPTQGQIDGWTTAYDALPHETPDKALDNAIDGAATLAALKAVLKGRVRAR